MKLQNFWCPRTKVWLGVIIGLMILSTAGFLGYRAVEKKADPPVEAPQTVKVGRGDVQLIVNAPGLLVSVNEQIIPAQVNGRLESLTVRPGDDVSKGQVLGVIGDKNDFAAAASAAQVAVLQAEQALELVKTSAPIETAQACTALNEAAKKLEKAKNAQLALKYPRATQARLDQVSAELQAAKQALALAQNAFDDVQYLAEDDPWRIQALRNLSGAQSTKDRVQALYNWLIAKPTGQDVSDAEIALKAAEAEFGYAQANWNRVKDGPDAQKLALAEAEYANKQAVYESALLDLDSLEFNAPCDGVILEVYLQPSQAVMNGSAVLKMTNPHEIEVLATVVEEDLPLLTPGQPVELFFDALPEALVSGKVSRIIPSRASGERALYPVYISLDEIPDQLVPGMTADGSIIIDQRTDVIVLPASAVKIGKLGSYVKVWNGMSVEERPVDVGLRGGANVEIVSGLREGELVVVK